MRRVFATWAQWCALLLILQAPLTALAKGNDCGRGPRRVPKPHGNAMRRARTLDLGERKTASHLISKPPEPRWARVAAQRGKAPKRLLWPVRGATLGRGFGYTRENLPEKEHKGVDINGKRGEVVRAAADGLVAYSDNGLCGYGNVVIIVHPNGWVTLYAHLQRATVQAGYFVARGERIGLVGDTGKARGAHLHFELYENGDAADPMPHFAGTKEGDSPRAKVRNKPRAKRHRKKHAVATPTSHWMLSIRRLV